MVHTPPETFIINILGNVFSGILRTSKRVIMSDFQFFIFIASDTNALFILFKESLLNYSVTRE